MTLLVKGVNTGWVFVSSSLQNANLGESSDLWATWLHNNDRFDVGQLKVKVPEVFLRHFIYATGSAFAPA